ncbi:MAG: carbohydrate kinase family protein [Patescibacteria group bacterium]|nr:carbohydrate kinase family protein [Patescibacteria group bacterium]
MNKATKGKSARFEYDVVTIGAATRDVFVKSKHFDKIKSASAPDGFDACLPMGAKIELDEIAFETGGGAANAATTFARFGFKTGCIARIGDDVGGTEVEELFKREGIDKTLVQYDTKLRTGYSIIILAGSGHRAILTSRGASRNIAKKEIPWQQIKTHWLYVSSLGGNMELLKDVFAYAKKNLIKIAWNPGGAELDMGMKKLLPYLMQADVLILNKEEAGLLANLPARQVDELLKKIGALPRTALVITDGAHGAYMTARGAVWHATALPGKILNTTGAGDAFGSAFTSGLMREGDLDAALKIAALNSHGVVTHMGATAGILEKYPTMQKRAQVKVKQLR